MSCVGHVMFDPEGDDLDELAAGISEMVLVRVTRCVICGYTILSFAYEADPAAPTPNGRQPGREEDTAG